MDKQPATPHSPSTQPGQALYGQVANGHQLEMAPGLSTSCPHISAPVCVGISHIPKTDALPRTTGMCVPQSRRAVGVSWDSSAQLVAGGPTAPALPPHGAALTHGWLPVPPSRPQRLATQPNTKLQGGKRANQSAGGGHTLPPQTFMPKCLHPWDHQPLVTGAVMAPACAASPVPDCWHQAGTGGAAPPGGFALHPAPGCWQGCPGSLPSRLPGAGLWAGQHPGNTAGPALAPCHHLQAPGWALGAAAAPGARGSWRPQLWERRDAVHGGSLLPWTRQAPSSPVRTAGICRAALSILPPLPAAGPALLPLQAHTRTGLCHQHLWGLTLGAGFLGVSRLLAA